MKYFTLLLMTFLGASTTALAVTPAEDVATTIKLRGYECGGREVVRMQEHDDGQGGRIIEATCPNGKRYRITVSADGRLTVRPLR